MFVPALAGGCIIGYPIKLAVVGDLLCKAANSLVWRDLSRLFIGVVFSFESSTLATLNMLY